MIPYDDLVIALATWRARQGLPVSQLSGALTPPPAAPAPAPAPAKPAAAPARTAPPGAPPGGLKTRPAAPAKAAAAVIEDSLDVEDEAFLEEAQSGGDFALTFDNPGGGEPGESTAIGVPPPPRSADGDGADDATPPPPPRRGGRDW
jgi:hypothetical protein